MAEESKKSLARWVNGRLARAYPGARCSLDYRTPFQLFVATVLSAQCTDARVNQVTPELFRRCPTPHDFLRLGQAGLEEAIRSTGFYRNKAKSILGACRRLVDEYGGEIPGSMEDLLTLPGVGRKTANVILGDAFGIQAGIVVDTHVGRVSRRIGLAQSEDPVKVEAELMSLFPRKDWTILSHRLILHGREVCAARSPRCDGCMLRSRCAYAASAASRSPEKPAGAGTLNAERGPRRARRPAAKR